MKIVFCLLVVRKFYNSSIAKFSDLWFVECQARYFYRLFLLLCKARVKANSKQKVQFGWFIRLKTPGSWKLELNGCICRYWTIHTFKQNTTLMAQYMQQWCNCYKLLTTIFSFLPSLQIPSNPMSCHMTSNHVISSLLIPFYVISFRRISSHANSCDLVSCNVMSFHIMSSHFDSSPPIPYSSHFIPSNVIPSHLISSHSVSCHFIWSYLFSSTPTCSLPVVVLVPHTWWLPLLQKEVEVHMAWMDCCPLPCLLGSLELQMSLNIKRTTLWCRPRMLTWYKYRSMAICQTFSNYNHDGGFHKQFKNSYMWW